MESKSNTPVTKKSTNPKKANKGQPGNISWPVPKSSLPEVPASRHQPSKNTGSPVTKKPKPVQARAHDSLPDPIGISHTSTRLVTEKSGILAPERKKLPVEMKKDEFLKLFKENQVICVTGPTGSGKTTMVCLYAVLITFCIVAIIC